MNLADKIQARGELHLLIRDGFGRVVREMVLGKNLIVTLAKTSMAIKISGDDDIPNNNTVTQMAWGQGGCEPLNPLIPIPPQPSDTSLLDQVLIKGIASHDFPAANRVRFLGILSPSELVGVGLCEAGLFTRGGTLFARKTFGRITKSAGLQFEFRWSIIF